MTGLNFRQTHWYNDPNNGLVAVELVDRKSIFPLFVVVRRINGQLLNVFHQDLYDLTDFTL